MPHKHDNNSISRQHGTRTRVFPVWVAEWLALILCLSGVLSGCGEAQQATPTAIPTAITTATPSATAIPTATPAQTAAPTSAGSTAYWPTGGWRTSTPEEQGVDSAQLLATLRHISEAGINVRTVTVVRNGYIVLEAANQPFTADMRYQAYSVTKSVTGALMGIAIHEGYIKDVKQTVLSYFPELTIANRDKAKEAITIEDLLTMQPGLDCADEKLNFSMEASKNWIQFALDLPMASPAGQHLVYCTAGPHILSAILTRATGMSTQAYAQSRLFDPLGISSGDISWQTDPQGITIGGYGISMKPRDMAKLGLLYLNGGAWDGKQVVPEAWVAASTSAHATGADHKDYGYLFWVYPSHYAAEGLGEQKIMVVKDRNMVVVMTSAIDWHKGPALEKLLDDYITPAAKSTVPLPANPAAYTSLQGRVKYMANPAQPVQPLSDVARRISGRTYVMSDNNPAGWKSVTLSFSEGSAEAKASVVGLNGDATVTQTVSIGMDNVYRVERTQDGAFTARRAYWLDDHTLIVRQLQSAPDIQETEIRVEFSGDSLKAHVEEVVFGTYTYDIEGTMSAPLSTPAGPAGAAGASGASGASGAFSPASTAACGSCRRL